MADIILVEDDEDDIYFFKLACNRLRNRPNLHIFRDGKALLDHLKQATLSHTIVMLDLNMPVAGGLDVLRELNSLELINKMVVLVYTTSTNQKDVTLSYQLGAKTYITKADSVADLQQMLDDVIRYWSELATLPVSPNGNLECQKEGVE